MTAAEQIINRIIEQLEAEGFGTDEPVNGADLVDTMAEWYDTLKSFMKGK